MNADPTCAIPISASSDADSASRALPSGAPGSLVRAHARFRALGEGANAQLKAWKILSKLRCCPWRAGKLAKAIHVLQLHAA